MNKKSQMYMAWVYAFIIVLIIILIPFVVYYITSSIYKTIDSGELNSIDYTCLNNTPSLRIIQSNSSQDIRPSPDDACVQECSSLDNIKNYYDMNYQVDCDNGFPVCNCQASYYSYYIKPLINY